MSTVLAFTGSALVALLYFAAVAAVAVKSRPDQPTPPREDGAQQDYAPSLEP